MSNRQQAKRARFAAFAKKMHFQWRMARKYRNTPGYLGVTGNLKVNGVDWGRGVIFATPSLRSKPFQPPNPALMDNEFDEYGSPVAQLAQTRTSSFTGTVVLREFNPDASGTFFGRKP